MKKIKNQKGITLVALVVTIIILIILAGISINAVIGENGIITLAKRAKENIELAQIDEQTELNELYVQLESESGELGRLPYDAIAKLAEFKKKIADYIDEAANGTIDITNEYTKPDYQTASDETFGNAIKQIVAKVTKLDDNVAATAEDIAEGKEAWVNGNKITGVGKNANSYYIYPLTYTNITFEKSGYTKIKFAISGASTSTSGTKKNYTISGSNDSSNYTTIWTYTGTATQAKPFSLTDLTVDISEYKYIRISSSTSSGTIYVSQVSFE